MKECEIKKGGKIWKGCKIGKDGNRERILPYSTILPKDGKIEIERKFHRTNLGIDHNKSTINESMVRSSI